MQTKESFISRLKEISQAPDPQHASNQYLQSCIAQWGTKPPWLPTPSKAEIDLGYSDPILSIFNIVWPPLFITEPHNHNMWATIGIYQGRENNLFWSRGSNSIEVSGGHSVLAGEVIDLSSDAIHSVHNPVNEYTAAIHIYGGDFLGTKRSEWDPLTLEERARDMANSEKAFEEANQ